ncbi:MAG: argininosuccinate lyase [Verrucomicrobia bacterium]|nr:argininosuccinate lyase [Verrucomicrobiota bacterium]
MWKGRFEKDTSDLVQRYGESISYDWRLYSHDIRGSIAHASALNAAGILTAKEFAAIKKGLNQIEKEIDAGTFEFSIGLEDIHMNIESALTRRIGAAGAKLHTARSRNDQIALDIRLYCRDEVREIIGLIRKLQTALVGCAGRHQSAVVPGYTHLQRGQPVLFAHHLLAYVEMLERDAARLADCLKRINVMPLGSGALAGSTIVLDRKLVAKLLEFPTVTTNSMDAISDRDFVAELLFAIALAGTHLSRLSEDVILWASAEFGFVSLSDAHTTGSSLMPQKKNPDVAELTRGKTGRLYGNLMSLLTLLKGLPMTYNRDLQEDKEPLFDSIDTIRMALDVFAEMVAAMKVNESVTLKAASDPFLLATDLADYLVKKGVPFRNAHEVIGQLTAHSLKSGIAFQEIPLETYRSFSGAFEQDLYSVLNVTTALKARKGIGAPSPSNVANELKKWKRQLAPKASVNRNTRNRMPKV